MLKKVFFLGAALLGVTFITGCGDANIGTVSGVVTLDGVPQPNLIVSFVPQAGGQTAIGKTDESGKYELYRRGEIGTPLGIYTVSIKSVQEAAAAPTADPEQMRSDSDDYMKQARGNNKADYANAGSKEKIPAKYNSATTLSETVESGDNVINFELTSE